MATTRRCDGCGVLGWVMPLFVRPKADGPCVLCSACVRIDDEYLAERLALAQPPFDRLVNG